MRIEILHLRDSDSDCAVRVFIDGVLTPVDHLEDVDPGRGYERSDWNENIRYLREQEGLSDTFRATAIAAYEETLDSKYVQNDLDLGGDDEETLLEIVDRKQQGVDCTQDESILIKAWFKEWRDAGHTAHLLRDLFPLEWDEAITELEAEEESS